MVAPAHEVRGLSTTVPRMTEWGGLGGAQCADGRCSHLNSEHGYSYGLE